MIRAVRFWGPGHKSSKRELFWVPSGGLWRVLKLKRHSFERSCPKRGQKVVGSGSEGCQKRVSHHGGSKSVKNDPKRAKKG